MQELKELEKGIYDYIVDVIRRENYSPSVRDIQNALNIKSTSTVHSYLAKLERKGYIQREPGKSRTLRAESFVAEPQRSVRVPILGRVAAGIPILAIENHEGYIDFPVMNRDFQANQLYALRVRGESMIEAGILEGDLIIVKKESTAENGDIVVALVGDEATVKTFYRENGHFRLQPENSAMAPIIVNDVYILGRVVSVLRLY